MSLAAAFLLVAAPAQAAPVDVPSAPNRGAQVATSRIGATILRPAVLRHGVLVTNDGPDAPHSQRHREGGRISYTFE